MKAVILAGGFGTRLRPLSCTRPKLLFPIANRPLLDWTFKNLAESGVKEVILAVNYMAEAFSHRYGNTAYKMKLNYSKETVPLGTGGPLKKAEDIIGHEEPFLVLNGDIFTTINYADVVKKHKQNRATASIMLYEVEDPSRYGTVELAKNNRVIRFVEKPAKGKAPSNLVNAGIYVLEPEIFDYIPTERRVSIEREVFPRLAAEKRLYAYDFRDLWIDIGKHEDFLRANRLLLDSQKKTHPKGKHPQASTAEIKDPVVIGKNVKIQEKSEIGPYAAIGDGVLLGRGVSIENSIIFPNAIISDFSSVRGAIVGEGAILGKWVKIEDNCIVGDYAMITDKVTLTQGVTVCPQKEVTESVHTAKNLM